MFDTGVLLPDTLAPSTAWIAIALNTAAVVTMARPFVCTLFDSLRIASVTLLCVCIVTVLELMHFHTSPWSLPAIFVSTLISVDVHVNNRQILNDAWEEGCRRLRGFEYHSKRF